MAVISAVAELLVPIHFAWALQQQHYCAACDDVAVTVYGSFEWC